MADPVLKDAVSRNISINVETIPHIKEIDESSSVSSSPVHVRIKLHNKDDNVSRRFHISKAKASQDKSSKALKQCSSEQTILSFNLFLESNNHESKPRKRFINRLLPNVCMGVQISDDEGPYLPSKACRQDSDSSINTGSSNETNHNEKKNKKKKYKSGGCLDPTISDDNFAYKPTSTNPDEKDEYIAQRTEAADNRENKSIHDLYQATNAKSSGLITYPHDSKDEKENMSTSMERTRQSSTFSQSAQYYFGQSGNKADNDSAKRVIGSQEVSRELLNDSTTSVGVIRATLSALLKRDEAERENKSSKKSVKAPKVKRRYKPGGCLEPQISDDEDYSYKPTKSSKVSEKGSLITDIFKNKNEPREPQREHSHISGASPERPIKVDHMELEEKQGRKVEDKERSESLHSTVERKQSPKRKNSLELRPSPEQRDSQERNAVAAAAGGVATGAVIGTVAGLVRRASTDKDSGKRKYDRETEVDQQTEPEVKGKDLEHSGSLLSTEKRKRIESPKQKESEKRGDSPNRSAIAAAASGGAGGVGTGAISGLVSRASREYAQDVKAGAPLKPEEKEADFLRSDSPQGTEKRKHKFSPKRRDSPDKAASTTVASEEVVGGLVSRASKEKDPGEQKYERAAVLDGLTKSEGTGAGLERVESLHSAVQRKRGDSAKPRDSPERNAIAAAAGGAATSAVTGEVAALASGVSTEKDSMKNKYDREAEPDGRLKADKRERDFEPSESLRSAETRKPDESPKRRGTPKRQDSSDRSANAAAAGGAVTGAVTGMVAGLLSRDSKEQDHRKHKYDRDIDELTEAGNKETNLERIESPSIAKNRKRGDSPKQRDSAERNAIAAVPGGVATSAVAGLVSRASREEDPEKHKHDQEAGGQIRPDKRDREFEPSESLRSAATRTRSDSPKQKGTPKRKYSPERHATAEAAGGATTAAGVGTVPDLVSRASRDKEKNKYDQDAVADRQTKSGEKEKDMGRSESLESAVKRKRGDSPKRRVSPKRSTGARKHKYDRDIEAEDQIIRGDRDFKGSEGLQSTEKVKQTDSPRQKLGQKSKESPDSSTSVITAAAGGVVSDAAISTVTGLVSRASRENDTGKREYYQDADATLQIKLEDKENSARIQSAAKRKEKDSPKRRDSPKRKERPKDAQKGNENSGQRSSPRERFSPRGKDSPEQSDSPPLSAIAAAAAGTPSAADTVASLMSRASKDTGKMKYEQDGDIEDRYIQDKLSEKGHGLRKLSAEVTQRDRKRITSVRDINEQKLSRAPVESELNGSSDTDVTRMSRETVKKNNLEVNKRSPERKNDKKSKDPIPKEREPVPSRKSSPKILSFDVLEDRADNKAVKSSPERKSSKDTYSAKYSPHKVQDSNKIASISQLSDTRFKEIQLRKWSPERDIKENADAEKNKNQIPDSTLQSSSVRLSTDEIDETLLRQLSPERKSYKDYDAHQKSSSRRLSPSSLKKRSPDRTTGDVTYNSQKTNDFYKQNSQIISPKKISIEFTDNVTEDNISKRSKEYIRRLSPELFNGIDEWQSHKTLPEKKDNEVIKNYASGNPSLNIDITDSTPIVSQSRRSSRQSTSDFLRRTLERFSNISIKNRQQPDTSNTNILIKENIKIKDNNFEKNPKHNEAESLEKGPGFPRKENGFVSPHKSTEAYNDKDYIESTISHKNSEIKENINLDQNIRISNSDYAFKDVSLTTELIETDRVSADLFKKSVDKKEHSTVSLNIPKYRAPLVAADSEDFQDDIKGTTYDELIENEQMQGDLTKKSALSQGEYDFHNKVFLSSDRNPEMDENYKDRNETFGPNNVKFDQQSFSTSSQNGMHQKTYEDQTIPILNEDNEESNKSKILSSMDESTLRQGGDEYESKHEINMDMIQNAHKISDYSVPDNQKQKSSTESIVNNHNRVTSRSQNVSNDSGGHLFNLIDSVSSLFQPPDLKLKDDDSEYSPSLPKGKDKFSDPENQTIESKLRKSIGRPVHHTKSTPSVISEDKMLKNGPLYADMTFKTYMNDKNQRVIKTLDSDRTPARNNKGSLELTHNFNKYSDKALIPISTSSNLVIQIQKNNNRDDKFGIPITLISNADKATSLNYLKHGEKQNNKPVEHSESAFMPVLERIYKRELLPLQKIIKSMKVEIESLSREQMQLNKRIHRSNRPERLIPVNGTCRCRYK